MEYLQELYKTSPETVMAFMSMETTLTLTLSLYYVYAIRQKRRLRKPKKRSVWVRPYLTRRKQQEHTYNLMNELFGVRHKKRLKFL